MGDKFGHRQKARGDFSRKFHNGSGKKFGGGFGKRKSGFCGNGEYRRSDFCNGMNDYGDNVRY